MKDKTRSKRRGTSKCQLATFLFRLQCSVPHHRWDYIIHTYYQVVSSATESMLRAPGMALTAPKKWGGCHGWTTEAQHDFLTSHLTGYFAAQTQLSGKGFETFWPRVYMEWFQQWPLPELSPKEVAQGVDEGPRKGEWIATQKLVSDSGRELYMQFWQILFVAPDTVV